ncbi:hypothetical protein Micbo1qcDRAFT_178144 [Microdochium bolleyi]|uniref:Uncharacterized protein n=1 Tax=Microdochium bolleyi TaxID=196109 RepID=A0A136IUE1_9PEZI|nr:hypothetical protein Micbo1qcDRAFT_178144 [Microdochium bolleyi]
MCFAHPKNHGCRHLAIRWIICEKAKRESAGRLTTPCKAREDRIFCYDGPKSTHCEQAGCEWKKKERSPWPCSRCGSSASAAGRGQCAWQAVTVTIGNSFEFLECGHVDCKEAVSEKSVAQENLVKECKDETVHPPVERPLPKVAPAAVVRESDSEDEEPLASRRRNWATKEEGGGQSDKRKKIKHEYQDDSAYEEVPRRRRFPQYFSADWLLRAYMRVPGDTIYSAYLFLAYHIIRE